MQVDGEAFVVFAWPPGLEVEGEFTLPDFTLFEVPAEAWAKYQGIPQSLAQSMVPS